MKLTKKQLTSMVKEVLNEEKMPFPGATLPGGNVPEDETNALNNLKKNFDIIRVYEEDEEGEDEEVVFEENEVTETVEEAVEAKDLTVADIVNEEIEKFIELKKKVISP